MLKQIFFLMRYWVCCLYFLPNDLEAKTIKHDKPIFVLFHGLGGHAKSFTHLAKGLKRNFPKGEVVALTSASGIEGMQYPTKKQAELYFQEIQSKVTNVQDRPLLLIGHSHGGICAYTFLKQYEKQLHIEGLVTLAAPWEGAAGARVNETFLKKHLTQPVINDLRTLATKLGYASGALERQIELEIQNNQMVALFPAARDIIPGSPLLLEIQTQLPYEKTAILAIAAGGGNFSRLLSNKSSSCKLTALNQAYALFVVGDNHPITHPHDMKLPCYSQHAEHFVPQKSKFFKRILIKDAFHDAKVWNTIPVPTHINILSHPSMLKPVTQFIKRVLRHRAPEKQK